MSVSEKQTSSPTHPEAKGLLLLGGCLILLLAELSFKSGEPASNWLGLFGYFIAFVFNYLFGLTSYIIILFFGMLGWRLLIDQEVQKKNFKRLYFVLFTLSSCLLLNQIAEHSLFFSSLFENKVYTESVLLQYPFPQRMTRHNLGGVPLYYLYKDLPTLNLQRMLSDVGITLTFGITALVSFLLLSGLRLLPFLRLLKKGVSLAKKGIKETTMKAAARFKTQALAQVQSPDQIQQSLTKRYHPPIYTKSSEKELKNASSELVIKEEPVKKLSSEESPPISKRQAALNSARVHNGDFAGYKLPPASLLTNPKKTDMPSLKKELRRQAEILEETLMSFGIEAKVGEINSGPTITSFEVHPSVGVKVQKITALENDIALNLQAKSIRIIAPIPGKAAVGIEIPSLYPQEVSFKEMLQSYQQSSRKFHIPVLLGKTVNGDDVMSDLAKMPHCIIAGATGSGKSVCINTVIMSILMNAKPDEIKLLMIDPKKVELTPYTQLPHLIAPVITEAHGAYAALHWLVKEMQLRYDLFKQLGVRNISAFNTRKIDQALESSLSTPVPEKMHAIVAIIDEFADLMMVSSSDLETPIARIAQMARAVGIHLVLATQRPSREVITGLIKANFPTRIAFKVASRVNSQIILDESGAESLLGNGDLLFLPPGSSHLMRAQGAYIRDEDINRVVSFICEQAPPRYLISSFDAMPKEMSNDGDENSDGSKDTLYNEARSIVLETNTASTTFLQRKLKIGYARAASLMDELEAKGVISSQEGSKPRRVLQNGNPLAKSSEKKGSVSDFEQEFLEE